MLWGRWRHQPCGCSFEKNPGTSSALMLLFIKRCKCGMRVVKTEEIIQGVGGFWHVVYSQKPWSRERLKATFRDGCMPKI